MKYRILAVIVVLLAIFNVNVFAASYEYHISPGANFTSAQCGDDLTQISVKLNMTADELNTYFNKNGLLYLAVSDDAKTQIRISAFTDNFSSVVNDMSELDETELNEFISAIDNNNIGNANVVFNNDRKFISVKSTRLDSGGTYTVTQFITICNNKTFYFSGYNDGEDTSDEIISAFKSFTLQEIPIDTPNCTVPSTLIIVGIIAFSILAIVMIVGIVKHIINSNFTKNKKYKI